MSFKVGDIVTPIARYSDQDDIGKVVQIMQETIVVQFEHCAVNYAKDNLRLARWLNEWNY